MKQIYFALSVFLLLSLSLPSVMAQPINVSDQVRERNIQRVETRNLRQAEPVETTEMVTEERQITRTEDRQELETRRQQNLEQAEQQRQQAIERQQAARQEMQDRQQLARDRMAQLHADRLERRFGFYYLRLGNIIERLQSRLDSMSAEGTNVEDAQEALDSASDKLDEAYELAQQAISQFQEASQGQSMDEMARSAASLALRAQTMFVEVVMDLRKVVRIAQAADGQAQTNN